MCPAASTVRRPARKGRVFTRTHPATHVDLPVVKLRLPGRRADATTPEPSEDLTAQLVRTGGKGRPTPKRSEAQGRRPGPPPPPPTTRKEAYRRMRANQAAGRTNTRLATTPGDDLPARDRGPERKLVRDIVDSRRNVGSVFLLVAVFLLIAQFTPNLAVKSYAFVAFTLFFVLLILDSFLLGRRIKKAVDERFPDSKLRPRSLVWYGISRSTMIRRWRFPKADVTTARRA